MYNGITRVVCLIAPPGAGKTTLSGLFERNGSSIITTSKILNDAGHDTSHGILLPDETVTSLLKDRLLGEFEISSTTLLDGFPRTISQLSFLEELTRPLGVELVIVFLKTPIEVAVGRYWGRINNTAKEKLREDDKGGEETLRLRYKQYEEWTDPILNHMIKNNTSARYVEVCGVGSPELVYERTRKKISRLQNKKMK